MSINQLVLFKVLNNSLVYPVFYVEATDILEATKIAKKVIDSLDAERVIGTVSAIDVPLLGWEEE
jgi:hypothetical protein